MGTVIKKVLQRHLGSVRLLPVKNKAPTNWCMASKLSLQFSVKNETDEKCL